MEIGIGLPGTVAGVTGAQIVDWARRAEHRGFSSLAVLDRLVYANYEPLIELAAAAAVTDRIRLATTVLIGPYRANAALLGKQLATIDHLSHGRLLIGIAAGSREDDYLASGVDFTTRGRQFEAMLDELELIWSEPSLDSSNPLSQIGPKPPHGRPPLIFGGTAPAASTGPPGAATAGSSAAGPSPTSTLGRRNCPSTGPRQAATTGRAPWRWPTSRSATTHRPRRTDTCVTTTRGSATTPHPSRKGP